MRNLQPGNPIADIDGGGGSVAAAAERLARAGAALAGRAAGALYRDGPPRPGPRSATWSSAWPVRS